MSINKRNSFFIDNWDFQNETNSINKTQKDENYWLLKVLNSYENWYARFELNVKKILRMIIILTFLHLHIMKTNNIS